MGPGRERIRIARLNNAFTDWEYEIDKKLEKLGISYRLTWNKDENFIISSIIHQPEEHTFVIGIFNPANLFDFVADGSIVDKNFMKKKLNEVQIIYSIAFWLTQRDALLTRNFAHLQINFDRHMVMWKQNPYKRLAQFSVR